MPGYTRIIGSRLWQPHGVEPKILCGSENLNSLNNYVAGNTCLSAAL